MSAVEDERERAQCNALTNRLELFLLFVSEGFVSLGGSEEKVPVKILRDTAAFDSFIHASVLPFSTDSDTGSCIPVLGVALKVLKVALYNIVLYSELFQGPMAVGVRPALPIKGITFILGNGAAWSRVWADGSPPLPVVSSVPVVRKQPDDQAVNFPAVFTACAVTRTMVRKAGGSDGDEGKGKPESCMFPFSDVPFTMSREELSVAQRADPSLRCLF